MKSTHGTLNLRPSGPVLFVELDAPPFNMLGPELVADLVELIRLLDQGEPYKVAVFSSANPDFFISHVDVARIKEYLQAAAELTGTPSIALLFRRLSTTKAVTIAQIEGRTRGAGSEFVLACDLRFGAAETAILGQMEGALGVIPGGGAIQYLVHQLGRGRALEVLLSADDYPAPLAERYGWINRALPAADLPDFVSKLAHRIAGFPLRGILEIKNRMNDLTLSPEAAYLQDSDAFSEGVRQPEIQSRIQLAVQKGFGNSTQSELTLGAILGDLSRDLA